MASDAELKIFTVDEANELLGLLSRLIERMKMRYFDLLKLIEQRDADPEQLEEFLQRNREEPEVRRFLYEMDGMIREIESHGCLFKGLDLGLVDFPAILEGKQICLCWQYGETAVEYYHGRDEGFTGRVPLKGSKGLSPDRLN